MLVTALGGQRFCAMMFPSEKTRFPTANKVAGIDLTGQCWLLQGGERDCPVSVKPRDSCGEEVLLAISPPKSSLSIKHIQADI